MDEAPATTPSYSFNALGIGQRFRVRIRGTVNQTAPILYMKVSDTEAVRVSAESLEAEGDPFVWGEQAKLKHELLRPAKIGDKEHA
jgi:hypothetical protein